MIIIVIIIIIIIIIINIKLILRMYHPNMFICGLQMMKIR